MPYIDRLSILFIFTAILATLCHAEDLPLNVYHSVSGATSIKADACEGKQIRKIEIEIRDIFEKPVENPVFRLANSLKPATYHGVVRQELLLHEGEECTRLRISESERLLRTLKFLRNTRIVPSDAGNGMVDILVQAQETWTFIPQINFSTGNTKKQQSAGLAESNLGGFGKRMEGLYTDDEGRSNVSGLYEDNRFAGTNRRLATLFIGRVDGYILDASFGRPIRSVFDKHSWQTNFDRNDTVGLLYDQGTESYIFRQNKYAGSFHYTDSFGNPAERLGRISYGFDYEQSFFYQASEQDYEDMNLSPAEVSNNLAGLPENRRFIGPYSGIQYFEPDYVSLNYTDRFERVDDYNLGNVLSVGASFAPELLGSYGNSFLPSITGDTGALISEGEFWRGEAGVATRLDGEGFANTLNRIELKYFRQLGSCWAGDISLGQHTLASSFFLNYGEKLDRDRQLLVGGENVLRGYPVRAFSGDKSIGLNVEDRIFLVENVARLVSIGAAFFVDAGGATYDNFGRLINHGIYTDVGFGLRFAFPRSSGGQVLRIDLAFPIRDADNLSDAFQVRASFAGGQLFTGKFKSESVGLESINNYLGTTR